MTAFRTLHRSILLLFFVVVLAIVTLVHFSISKIVAEQSRAQQKSLSPAINLIVNELLKPLHTAEALGHSPELVQLLDQDKLDGNEVLRVLKRMEQQFDLVFFLASEKERMQYMSDGMVIPLIEGQVSWYFKYKDRPETAVADIGKWEDTHFYIDIKIFDKEGEFLGFFGVGQSLSSFLTLFDEYKNEYGYDFIFVDENSDIMLSSDASLIAEYSEFTNLSQLDWFAQLPAEVRQKRALNNRLVTIDEQEYLIAEVGLNQFDWTVFLLSPLEKRQAEISQGFILTVVALLIVVFSLFVLVYHVLSYFRRDIHRDIVIPPPARLPDRMTIEDDYNRLLNAYQYLSIVLVNIDNFAIINDTYGRSTGDEVHQHIVHYLQSQLGTKSVLGLWSSEEFIILLPELGPHEARKKAEELREGILNLPPINKALQLKLSASFGISYTATRRPMSEVASYAEDALYQAQRDGRNLVRLQLIS
ncbi:GGDEF domain-containing protein [Salinimonas marina]|uniref:diguanylate cyclase n=1 Tax=Salinimonas marina TaxID=2785918 RepID=A0A7S9HD42_9ALTE|nr:sensor domain-containing diguanylate cyclase [Salinimonas marina]QPG05527.1 GGDEF domain-containing protein [Salinimonas marina]